PRSWTPERLVGGVPSGRFRTALGRACRDTGTPLLSPHDLRHRRISVGHRAGISWALIGNWVGQPDLATTANTYTHVIADDKEADVASLLSELVETDAK